MVAPSDLPARWRELAQSYRDIEATAQAAALELAAKELERSLNESANELLNLQQAAAESGYSADHLGDLVREGRIPNAGRKHAPKIRRVDLPTKPGHVPPPVAEEGLRGASIRSSLTRRAIQSRR